MYQKHVFVKQSEIIEILTEDRKSDTSRIIILMRIATRAPDKGMDGKGGVGGVGLKGLSALIFF